MNSLLVKILTAVLTFTIGVGVASLWLASRRVESVFAPVPTETASARLCGLKVLAGPDMSTIPSSSPTIWMDKAIRLAFARALGSHRGGDVTAAEVAYRELAAYAAELSAWIGVVEEFAEGPDQRPRAG